MVELLLGDGGWVDALQRLIASEVARRKVRLSGARVGARLGLTYVGLADVHLGVGLDELGLGLGDLSVRLGETGLRLVETGLVVAWIDLQQRLAGVHPLVILHQHARHPTGNPRRGTH